MSEPWLEQKVKYIFQRRPYSLPADLRPDWRIAMILLILSICCKGQRSNIKRLRIMNWACGTPETRHNFNKFLDGRISPDQIIARYEPWFAKAMALAEGEDLVIRKGSSVSLTPRGMEIVNDISATNDLFKIEIEFLKSIGKKVTEKKIDELLEGGVNL